MSVAMGNTTRTTRVSRQFTATMSTMEPINVSALLSSEARLLTSVMRTTEISLEKGVR